MAFNEGPLELGFKEGFIFILSSGFFMSPLFLLRVPYLDLAIYSLSSFLCPQNLRVVLLSGLPLI